MQNFSIIKSVKISRFFSVKRDCPGGDFLDPSIMDCVNNCATATSPYIYNYNTNKVCVACHFSCLTCNG